MASNPPGACCLAGAKHEGTPTGEIKQLENFIAYVATPKGTVQKQDKALIIISDVYGHTAKNCQLLADQFAANGYRTVIPDILDSDPVPEVRPPGWEISEWLKNHGPERVDPLLEATIEYLRKEGAQRIGGIGYCFGGRYLARFMAAGSHGQKIDVGYTAHPSFMSEDELRGVSGPFSIAAAAIDTIFTAEKRHFTEETLETMGVKWELALYGGVEHGFAVRGDVSEPHIKYAKEAALEQAVRWMNAWL